VQTNSGNENNKNNPHYYSYSSEYMMRRNELRELLTEPIGGSGALDERLGT